MANVPLLAASDRAVNDSLADAKEGLVVSCVDAFETYKSYARYERLLYPLMRFSLFTDMLFLQHRAPLWSARVAVLDVVAALHSGHDEVAGLPAGHEAGRQDERLSAVQDPPPRAGEPIPHAFNLKKHSANTLRFHPQLVQYIYPDLYRVDELSDIGGIEDPADKEIVIPQPPRLQVRRMMIEAFD